MPTEHAPVRNIVTEGYVKNFDFMARTAGLVLSPESRALYCKLRLEDPANERYSGMGDHQLLAEVLRQRGELAHEEQFKKAFREIFKESTDNKIL